MDYLTTAEMAKLWNVTQRWVAILCKRGVIEGAVLRGNTWFVPKDAKKPEDHRFKVKRQNE